MQYKLVISDIDGTLLNEQSILTTRTKNAVKNYMLAGGQFMLATGRRQDSVKEIIAELNLTGAHILMNGAVIMTLPDEKVIREHALPAEVIGGIIEIAKKYQLKPLVHFTDAVYATELNDRQQEHIAKEDLPVQIISNYDTLALDQVMKLFFVQERNLLNEFRDDLYQNFTEDQFHTVFSEENYFEILGNNITKGSALLDYAEVTGIDVKQIMAFGDEENDLEMLQMAGCGVAMGNAKSKVKRVADQVALANSQDGVAVVLEKLIQ